MLNQTQPDERESIAKRVSNDETNQSKDLDYNGNPIITV